MATALEISVPKWDWIFGKRLTLAFFGNKGPYVHQKLKPGTEFLVGHPVSLNYTFVTHDVFKVFPNQDLGLKLRVKPRLLGTNYAYNDSDIC